MPWTNQTSGLNIHQGINLWLLCSLPAMPGCFYHTYVTKFNVYINEYTYQCVHWSTCTPINVYTDQCVHWSTCTPINVYTDQYVYRSMCTQINVTLCIHCVHRSMCTQINVYTDHQCYIVYTNQCIQSMCTPINEYTDQYVHQSSYTDQCVHVFTHVLWH